jgi:hypothetical protein
MTRAFALRFASVLFLLTLLAAGTPATAGRGGSAYGRSGSRGRVVLHRPNYKQYNANHSRWFFQRW